MKNKIVEIVRSLYAVFLRKVVWNLLVIKEKPITIENALREGSSIPENLGQTSSIGILSNEVKNRRNK